MQKLSLGILLTTVMFFSGCQEEIEDDNKSLSELSSTTLDQNCSHHKNALTSALRHIQSDTDFTLLIKNEDNMTFSFNSNQPLMSENKTIDSASTSKLVTAVVILDAVEQSSLTLDSHPQEYIDSWPQSGNLSEITLKELLNFTSGLNEVPFCLSALSLGATSMQTCVDNIISSNVNAPKPSHEFYYASTHLQVAGLMAIHALSQKSWSDLFNNFKSRHNIFASANYTLPSLTNPRLAGGLRYTANEYIEFLELLYEGKLLSSVHRKLMMQDHIKASEIVSSPARDGINEDWHYGFGVWIECHNAIFNCENNVTRISSAGAFGAYPFIDYEHHYYGILARQGAYGTFDKGYKLFETIEPYILNYTQCKEE